MAQKRKTIKEVLHTSLLEYIESNWVTNAKYEKNRDEYVPVESVFSSLPKGAVLVRGEWIERDDHYYDLYDYQIVQFRVETYQEYSERLATNRKADLARKKNEIKLQEQKEAEERAEFERLRQKYG